jgi:hypothetical protein
VSINPSKILTKEEHMEKIMKILGGSTLASLAGEVYINNVEML